MADTPRDILLFVAAYEERSFTAAAVREGATQSGVSQHIRKLEERFGARLFSREAGRVVPTPAADAYYNGCLNILRAHEAAADTLRRHDGLQGEVAVGLMPTMTRCALTPALAGFMDRHPNVTVRVVEAYSGSLTEQVRAGVLDFAVVPAFADAAGLDCRAFASTPEVLVGARTDARYHAVPTDLRTLGPLNLVVPERQNTRRLTIETYLARNAIPVARMVELDSMMGTLDLVANSGWVTILPGVMMARDRTPGRFTINPLAAPPLSLDLVAIETRRRALSPAGRAFQDMLRDATMQQGAVWTADHCSPPEEDATR